LDDDGVTVNGLWCAKIDVEDKISVQASRALSKDVLSAVAIPLWCVLGKEHPDALKYCVLTNYWKVRMSDGWHRMPKLDASLCGGEQGNPQNPLDDCDLEFPFDDATKPGAKKNRRRDLTYAQYCLDYMLHCAVVR